MKKLILLCVLMSTMLSASEVKKGLCLSYKKNPDWKKKVLTVNAGWTYNWTAQMDHNPGKSVQFVPMIFKLTPRTDDRLKDLSVRSPQKKLVLLGPNEPDGKKQGNMTVAEVIKLWPKLEKTKRRLGSPATKNPTNEWMKQFMAQAKKKKLRVDFVCVHWYGNPNPQKFLKMLKEVHELYGKPIWITEFAVADWDYKKTGKNKYSAKEVAKFINAVLPELEKLDYIERYTWFHSSDGKEQIRTSMLFNKQGKLTQVGKAYAKNHKQSK